MNNIKLSNRLHLLLDKIPTGSKFADIGSDHALLPIAAIESGKAVFAIAGEVNPGPFDAACKAVAAAGQGKVISVRRGDGLEVLKPGEVDCITIAGMGGSLIASILNRGQANGKLQGVSVLALQPNVAEDILRRWLVDNGWVLIAENILEEDGKIYEVLTAVPEVKGSELSNENLYKELLLDGGKVKCGGEMLVQMGPWLLRSPNAAFHSKWRGEISKLETILASLSRSELESAEQKRITIQARIQEITEVLQCLPKDKP
ncbi:tRNA (adenine(22)-N(1))-methyltransferase [Paenibacillus wynnii]|uniref:tRNA (adenine(22)-N(1))-methyltransferase n=1 Tax=Paenibacillus wynnii TaxID=268407 RepID=UPI00278C96D2|nr:tRNA (adenine(22)-N(1))-methyltransferase TrmK [Paenibacillus wynnii]MDQ0192618.1 tRNA (adenine22-N1)-methyltransferase [Paenibacillus wynnii]